ncbi:glycoside hydrolase family 99-like domain-containing protein [Xanthomonas sacchari]|uniref:glycoside hydrolase family 99-like domain-containing protein n=1 Tax=Xanthomonas sacchari TaxID=56458 RepID=UPI0020C387C1|nr:glycoside hydrolase family 99-like domain-containing protein [Xanthomonas sacchari]
MSESVSGRLRTGMYRLMRLAFRALPIADGTRDRWRNWFLDRYAGWAPAAPKGQVANTGTMALRALHRADEAAIGHVPYRKSTLPAPLPATLVAFYLPQFHAIPENDAWWGKGFTEWRNVSRALPQFYGHMQPRIPADLGFYNLRDREVMRQQAQLASEYGIGAFCFYFYWFAGKTLLEEPIRNWRDDATISLPYCLCWANENWARRWDGRNTDILIAQQHSDEDDLAFIAHLATYLVDPRYLRVDGKPLVLVYRPNLMPDPKATASRWRAWCAANGIGEIHLAYVQGFERPDPREIGFDAAVEFPPNMSAPPSVAGAQLLINPDFSGEVLDWRVLAAEMAARPLQPYTLYPGVNPGWDNEPRRSGKGRIYLHASPRGYEAWLSHTIHDRLAPVPAAQRLVFVNAWNEWAEGAVLEPDARLGHAWLEATRRALHPTCTPAERPYVVIHAWYVDVLEELLAQVRDAAFDHHLIVTTTERNLAGVNLALQRQGMEAEVVVHDNHGRDILPFLRIADRLLNAGASVVLKLHTKRSVHRQDGDQWRREMVGSLLERDRVKAIVDAFKHRPDLGLVAPEGHIQRLSFYWGANEQAVRALATRMGLAQPDIETAVFAGGSMFWVRLQAIQPILDCHLQPGEFEKEAGQVDGTLAHAIERLFSLSAVDRGYALTSAASIVGAEDGPTVPYKYARKG